MSDGAGTHRRERTIVLSESAEERETGGSGQLTRGAGTIDRDAARELRKISQSIKIILLTRHDEPQYVTEALRAGVKGYVLKSQAANDLVGAIHQVGRGGIYLSPNISRTVVDAYLSKTEPAADPLTARERQVLQMVGEGKSTKDVARLLGISTKTAESHRARLMRKLDIHETASLVRYAIRRGLVQP